MAVILSAVAALQIYWHFQQQLDQRCQACTGWRVYTPRNSACLVRASQCFVSISVKQLHLMVSGKLLRTLAR